MFTKKELKKQLETLGVPQDVPVLVHTSLRAIGETEGRADGFLDVLIEHCTEKSGLLCIPTHTWAFARQEGRIALDLTKTETCIGTLPEIALKRADVIRSMHPTHSMAVFGDKNKAEAFAKGEDKFCTPADPNGCYGKIYKQNGYILLIGVGHERNTFIHCVDEMLGVKNRFPSNKKSVTVRLKSGEILKREIYPHFAKGIGTSISARFPKFETAFEYNNALVKGKIGNADAQLCSAVKIKDTLEKIYKRSNGAEFMADDLPIDEKYYK